MQKLTKPSNRTEAHTPNLQVALSAELGFPSDDEKHTRIRRSHFFGNYLRQR